MLGRAIREQPRIFAVAVTGSVLFGLMVIASAFVVGRVVGKVVVPAVARGSVATGTLALAAAALFGISVLRVVGIFGRRLGAGYMQYRLQAAYRRRVTRRYLDLPLAWHHRNATGTLLSNANSDVEAAWYPIAPLPFAVGTVVMLVGAVVSLFLTDWALALVGLAVFPALFALNVVYSRRMAPRQARAQRLRAEVSGIAHESFDGALVVKTMGREAQETARFAARAGELRDALISVGKLRGVFDPMLETLPSLGTLAVLVVGALRLRQGAIDVTELVSVAFLFTVLAFPVRAIGWVLAELPRSVAGWDRVRRVLDATGEMPYGNTTLDPATPTPATLAFHDVHFGYEPAEAHLPGTEVLGEVTFTVPAGKTVALVGPTGAGKSTIASLAVRLVDPHSGAVTVDGVDVRELAAASLASTVALVAQVPFVFDDTVRANIALDRPGIGDEEVWAALRLAEADGFVAALPDGLDTVVGERGTSLSGGQRQRLTLARALAGRPRLLVLDDATSAVDPRVEAAILAGLRAPDDGVAPASILVVAYRRATIALADEVIYVEHGRVVARGTHPELLATVPGYADLVTAYEQAEQEREQTRTYDEVTPLTSGLEVEVDR
ncbi:ABC transporter ATP-binding protein [Micromonospora sp. PPF5-17]|uniref:ABC transporter ATP-binding protein n=1 Tax=Micromonospora solifontis TaxID=2487138 RepID=A0ABX9WH70_9ACTN|nr:ABC transporter ATP-binding protein [Micromonospora sp. PPF5-17B]NES36976.1 ABC transporter ATP-binding protein [Micromonospora solifontis]NES54295.1 ABC transporter ATP-binding protein [Micromonospora sp. PPF5-6]RNL98896.1 ABC transporter ATP-binding protein [Micromonospora solifontis]